mgnify:CR=1 FL=1
MYNLIALNKNHIELVIFAFILIVVYAFIYWKYKNQFTNLNSLLDGLYLS